MSSGFSLPRKAHHTAAALHAGAVRILEDALDVLRERRGLDFSGYRRGTLERRLANRIAAAGVEDAEGYLTLLRDSDSEAERLTASLTIKVSRFYRNAAVFDDLRDRVLPDLRARFPREPLRIWSAGCATGEEAYTLAMMIGDDDRICATDIDETALAVARRGIYPAESLVEAAYGFARDHLHPADSPKQFAVGDAVRRRVAFVRHDLAAAEPAPGPAPFHLICCRNVLIYFTPPLQERALRLLTGSLVPGGVLCLGEAEWPGAVTASLEVLDRRLKFFRRPAALEETR